jgi:hypothetical protein
VSPCCAMGFACGREVAGGGERRGRRRPSSPRVLHISRRSNSCGPGRARACARAHGGRGGGKEGDVEGREEEVGWDGRSGGGKKSVALTPVSRDSGSSRSARAPCMGPRSHYQPVQREQGRRGAAPRPLERLRLSRIARSESKWEISAKCCRARWSPRGAATGGTLLAACSASCTRERVREGATRACGAPARRASSTRVEGEGPEVWGRREGEGGHGMARAWTQGEGEVMEVWWRTEGAGRARGSVRARDAIEKGV